MNMFGDHDRKNGPSRENTVQYNYGIPGGMPSSTANGARQYAGNNGYEPPKKKGIAGIVIACTLSAALIGGVVGGIGGMALGYRLSPERQVAMQTLESTPTPAMINQQSASDATAVPSAISGTMSLPDIIDNVSPSVVAINSTVTMQQFSYFGPVEQEGQGSGSGVIISEDGYILTNNHVIEGAKTVQVVLSDGTTYDAKPVGGDPDTDIAVIKVEAVGLPVAELGASKNLRVGDVAIAIGNPTGTLANSSTQGIISALEREITIEGTTMSLLQFDAAVSPGNSGGALVNGSGQVVGIVNAKNSGTYVEGIGFAIPIDNVQDVIQAIIENKDIATGRMAKMGIGTKTVTEDVSAAYGLPIGAYVVEVESFSAAERAGVKVGDVIVKFGGQEVEASEDVSEIRDQHKIGDTVQMVVNRNGTEIVLEITLLEEIKTF